MQVTLIHNPSAGDNRPNADDLKEILEGVGFQVRYASSKRDWKRALEKPADLVVVAGGDGTVAKVIRHLAGSDTPLALLPLGKANNIARTLGVAGDARELAAAWHRAEAKPLDVGLLRTPWGEERFVESVGAGIFAEAIVRGHEEVKQSRSIVGSAPDRAMHLVRTITETARRHRYEIELDDQDLSGDYLAVEVMNVRFGSVKIPLAPEADSGDGLLDLVLVGEEERPSLIEHLSARVEQGSALPPALPIRRGKRVSLRLEGPFPEIHRDDDLLGPEIDEHLSEAEALSFEVALEPAAVKMLQHRR
jgi:diacylglycerol kinase (ATP)